MKIKTEVSMILHKLKTKMTQKITFSFEKNRSLKNNENPKLKTDFSFENQSQKFNSYPKK